MPRSRSLFLFQRTGGLKLIGMDIDTHSRPPQSFEIIKAPRLFIENMKDEIAIVNQDPFRRLVAFDAGGACAAALQLLYNFIAVRLHLTLIRTRGDHKKISEAGNSAQIK